MDISAVIKQRRTFHEFSNEKVDQEIINEAMGLATWAPNHKLTFPWVFYDIGPTTKEKLIDLAIELKLKKSKAPIAETILQSLRGKLNSSSHMIGIGLKVSENQFQAREDYATVACGVQNMSLYLHSKGLGSKWSTGGFTSHEKTYEILNINRKKVELVGVLLIGVIKNSVRTPERPAASTFIHRR